MKQSKNIVSMTAQERENLDESLQGLIEGAVEQTVFLDIETTGFSRLYDSIYLIGLLYRERGELVLEQWLAESEDEEPQLLQQAGSRLRNFRYGITYNGEAFDLPFLQKRAQKLYVRDFALPEQSVDLFRRYHSYRKWFGWPDQKLKTIERFLNIDREDPFTGGQLIEVFREYARTGAEPLEKVLLLHNYEDIENMPALLRIEDFWRFGHSCRIRKAWLEEGELCFAMDRCSPMTAEGRSGDKGWHFEAGSTIARLTRPIHEGELRYYLPGYRDYYYLPETQEIVHRSLAGSIPAAKRRPASREVCYLTGRGRFWPGTEGECPGLRAYRQGCRDKKVYYAPAEFTAWLAVQEEEVLTQWFRKLWQ